MELADILGTSDKPNRTKTLMPWEQEESVAPMPTPPESPGVLATLGDVIDRPGNALRGVLAGRPGALKGLIPFGETMGVFGDEDRVSGQDVLKNLGIIDQKDPSLLSGAGAAGLGAEILLDPLNLAFGLGALTKAGKAAKAVGALEKGWGAAGRAGQRALLGVGGDFNLFGKTLFSTPELAWHAPKALEAIESTGKWAKAAPFAKPITDLFNRTPEALRGITGGEDAYRAAKEAESQALVSGSKLASDRAAEFEKIMEAGARPAGLPQEIVDFQGDIARRGEDIAGQIAPMMKDSSPIFQDAVRRAIEQKSVEGLGEEAVKAVQHFEGVVQDVLKIEQAGLPHPTAALQDPKLGYFPRIATPHGQGYLKGMKSGDWEKVFKNLGVEAEGAGDLARPVGRNFEIPGAGVIGDWHESQWQRLPEFQGRSVEELNRAFQAAGGPLDVFTSSPAEALRGRLERHARAMSGAAFFEAMAKKLGGEVPTGLKAVPYEADQNFLRFIDPAGKTVGFGLNPGTQAIAGAAVEGSRHPATQVMFKSPEIAQAVRQATQKISDPQSGSAILDWFDRATRTYKAWVTKGFPAFGVRNRVSNRLASAMFEDVPIFGEHYGAANRLIAGKAITWDVPGMGKVSEKELVPLMESLGVMDRGFFDQAVNPASWNPLAADNRIVGAMEKVSAGIAGGPGQILSGAGTGKIREGMTQRMVEQVDRVGHFLSKLQQGFQPMQAAESVKKALFDYGDLSDFEKKVMGRLVFFYTYQRKVLPLVMETMLQRPGRIHQMSQVGGGAGPTPEGLPENLSPYIKEGMPLPVGKDEKGNVSVLTQVETPWSSAVRPLAGFGSGLGRGVEQLLAQTNPVVIKPSIELGTGRNLAFGKDVEDVRKAPDWVKYLPQSLQDALSVRTTSKGAVEADPWALWTMGQSPLSRFAITAGKLVDERKDAAGKVLNLLTGSKVVSVDPQEEEYLARKRIMKSKLEDLQRKGKVAEIEDIFRLTESGKEDPEADEIRALIQGYKGKKSKKEKQVASLPWE